MKIACCPNGDMVVGGDYLYILDRKGEYKMSLTLTETDANKRIGYVKDIAGSPEGYIVLVGDTEWVWVFGLDYKYLHCFNTLTPDDGPNTAVNLACIAVDREGQVLVGDTMGIITIHSCPDGKMVRKIKCTICGLPSMVVNSKNQILLHFRPSDSVYSKVVAIDYSGNEVFSFTLRIDGDVRGEGVWPGGIVCDEKDYIYIAMRVAASYTIGYIHKYSPTGGFLQCITQGLGTPRDLSFSPDASLMIANVKSILKYSIK